MFSQAWNKYLPVIRILMKRSVTGPQKLDTNRTDFEKAAGGRKLKFTFTTVTLTRGRVQAHTPPPPVARDLVLVLQQDPMTRELIRSQEYEFSMDSLFQLAIKNITPPAEPTIAGEEKEENG